MTPPEGFTPHKRKSPLTDPWEPLFSKRDKDAIIIGLYAAEAHCNSRGLIHGGLISALADNAMGLSCAGHHDRARLTGLVTVSLHIDFTGAAKIGDWVEFVTTSVVAGKSLDAAQGCVTANGKVIAHINATFRVYMS